MEKISLMLRSAIVVLAAITFFGCSKSSKQVEEPQPKETVVLDLINVNDQRPAGSLFIDDINGKARARIILMNESYEDGINMKANVTLNSSTGTIVYAHCTDVDGRSGKCSTFPITILADGSDALYQTIKEMKNLDFNILDASGKVKISTSARMAIHE